MTILSLRLLLGRQQHGHLANTGEVSSSSRAPTHNRIMEIQFTTRIFKEGRTFVAHALELDISSCGGSKDSALKNLKDAVRLFLEEAGKMGTLDQILQEAGYTKSRQRIASPKFISVERTTLPFLPAHAKT
jgi:hypothetical protein